MVHFDGRYLVGTIDPPKEDLKEILEDDDKIRLYSKLDTEKQELTWLVKRVIMDGVEWLIEEWPRATLSGLREKLWRMRILNRYKSYQLYIREIERREEEERQRKHTEAINRTKDFLKDEVGVGRVKKLAQKALDVGSITKNASERELKTVY